jgi:multidrug efflux pump subunit AcrA (membrane-fusion protein)
VFIITVSWTGYSQTNNSTPSLESPSFIRNELAKEGKKLSQGQFMSYLELHRQYAAQVSEAEKSGNASVANNLKTKFNAELSEIFTNEQSTQYFKICELKNQQIAKSKKLKQSKRTLNESDKQQTKPVDKEFKKAGSN